MNRLRVPGPSWNLSVYRPTQPRESDEHDDAPTYPTFQSTLGQHGFTVLPEDIDFEAKINPCTFEPGLWSDPTFDYVDFMYYNRLLTLLFQLKKLNAKKSSNEEKGPLKPPTIEFVKRKFIMMYDDADFKSPHMKVILETMKDSLMEQALQDPNDPEIMLQLLEEGIEQVDSFVAESQLTHLIHQRFDDDKIKLYSNFSPHRAKGEWFVLPRGHPYDVSKKIFEKSIRVRSSTPSSEIEDKPSKLERSGTLRNLHLYDPRFEYRMTFPSHIFTEDFEDWEEWKAIPPLLCSRIMTHLSQFPFGISPSVFWESFEKKHGTKPTQLYFGLHEILEQFPDEIWTETGLGLGQRASKLLFSGFLENAVNPRIILKRAWHLVTCIVGRNGFVLAEKLFELFEQEYNFKFKPEDWGFERIHAFVHFCNERFATVGISVHRVLCTMNGIVHHFDYLLIDSNEWRRHVEKLHGLDDPDIFKLQPVPQKYLGHRDVIDALFNHYSKRDTLVGGLEFMTDPFNMFVVLRAYKTRLNIFMNEIQRDPAVVVKPPSPQLIEIGMYVLAFTKEVRADIKEWYRVKVLRKGNGETGTSYLVHAIDYGFHSQVQLSDIRLLPRGTLSEELAYAIPIRVKMYHPDRKKKFIAGRAASKIMYNICFKNALVIRLSTGRFKKSLGCMKWKVTCFLAKRYPNVELIRPKELSDMFEIEFSTFMAKQNRNKPEGSSEVETVTATLVSATQITAVVGDLEQQEAKVSVSEQHLDEISVPELQVTKANVPEQDQDDAHDSGKQEVKLRVPLRKLQVPKISVPEQHQDDTSDSGKEVVKVSVRRRKRKVALDEVPKDNGAKVKGPVTLEDLLIDDSDPVQQDCR